MKYLFEHINPFEMDEFKKWFQNASKHSSNKVLDPFAGTFTMCEYLLKVFPEIEIVGFDIHPRSTKVQKRDTLESFPRGYNLVVTNLPYLSRKEAIEKNYTFPENYPNENELYEICIKKIFENVDYAAIIMPVVKSFNFVKGIDVLEIKLANNMFDQKNLKVSLYLVSKK